MAKKYFICNKIESGKKRLITCALPYVNNEPHLGTLLQVVSADVFSRFCRQKGYESLFICGTDEYGTATETKALEQGKTPKELCDSYFKVHEAAYKKFGVSFGHFGRTSTPAHIPMVQWFYNEVKRSGYITSGKIDQLYCPKCSRFLADRFVLGKCPKCGGEAKGDQCSSCGAMLSPTELTEPKCAVCGSTPIVKSTEHLFLDLPRLSDKLNEFVDECSAEWAQNAVSLTRGWIKQGLEKRSITRDLKWGVPVPDMPGKVFYVWFDANIGYVTFTQEATGDWQSWWRNPDNVSLYQFIGKDNIPFHTIVFPAVQKAIGGKQTMVTRMSSSEYINYEGGKFSKSQGIGVFASDIDKTGVSPEGWRMFLMANRPEKQDYNFTWDDFAEKFNSDIVGNLANLHNRTVVFASKLNGGNISDFKLDEDVLSQASLIEKRIDEAFEKIELKAAMQGVLSLSDLGNKYFQNSEPWKLLKTDPEKCKNVLASLLHILRDIAILIQPFAESVGTRILSSIGVKSTSSWDDIGTFVDSFSVKVGEHLFERLTKERVDELKAEFGGKAKSALDTPQALKAKEFASRVILKVSKIESIQKHPEGDLLYILTLNTGCEEKRTIVSSIVPYYREDELLGHNIVLVSNLKPANFRGVKSCGMLLAASDPKAAEHTTCEVLFADNLDPGTVLLPQGVGEGAPDDVPFVKGDKFFSYSLATIDGQLCVEGIPLVAQNKNVCAKKYLNGPVG